MRGFLRISAGLALGLLALAGCAPSEGTGVMASRAPMPDYGLWRESEAQLFLAPDGPEHPGPEFLIPDRGAQVVRITLTALGERPFRAEVGCEGRALLRRDNAPDLPLNGAGPRPVALDPEDDTAVRLEWFPESGACTVRWGESHVIPLRPESAHLPELDALSAAPVTCAAPRGRALDPLQRVFLEDSPMLQTCPMAQGPVRVHSDPLDALNARFEALTGRRVSRAAILAGDPDMPIDFSNAPDLEMIQLSYLHIRADYVGYLTARMLVHHALRGAQVRILVTGVLMLGEDRDFYESLAARYPNIQLQYFYWDHTGFPRWDDAVNRLHRVQHTRAFLTLSRTPGASRFIFGGRNQHDGFFFNEPFDLTAYPYLHTYNEDAFQDLGFYSIYEDHEVELRGDAAVRAVAAHHVSMWNRDARTQTVAVRRAPATDRLSGMRHYLSIPWGDGREQILWYSRLIDAARSEVLIVTPYLNPPDEIQAALERAVARGVPVRMVVRLESTDPSGFVVTALNRHYAQRWSGLFEISEYFPDPRMMHTKMIFIDRRLAVSTSTNLDHRSFWHDTENGLVFLDTPAVEDLLAVVDSYRPQLRRLTPDEPLHPLSDFLYNWYWLRTVF